MIKPKKDPMGDEHIPGEEPSEIEEPQKKELPKEDPENPKKRKLPPDPESPDAPIKK